MTLGMAAMRLPAISHLNLSLVVMSVVFAVLISSAALWITFHFRDERKGTGWEKLAGAVVMGCRDPRDALHRYGRRQFHALGQTGRPVSRYAVRISNTLHRRNCRRHFCRPRRVPRLTSWLDRRFAARDLGTAGREAAAKRSVLGGGAEAHAHRELGLAGSGKGRLASIRGM